MAHPRTISQLAAAIAAVFFLCLGLAGTAFAQVAVLQGGPFTQRHAPMYTGSGPQAVLQDSGPASGGGPGLGFSEILSVVVKSSGGTPYPAAATGTGPYGTNWCDYDAPTTNATGYHYLCFSPNAQGGGLLAYGAGGIAAELPMQFSINGVLSTSLCTIFTSTTFGCVPASGGGTVNYLRADGTWAAPAAFGGSAANKITYVSTAGSDSYDGLSWATAKLTIQAGLNAANPGGTVNVGAGTYTLTTALLMQPNVKLACTLGTKITQGTSANLSALFNFGTNTANGASVSWCDIDGNSSNNTMSTNHATINVGGANDAVLEYNIIENSPGYSVLVGTGLRPGISHNKFRSFYVAGVTFGSAMNQYQTRGTIEDNWFTNTMGQHAILINNSDNNHICHNKIFATQLNGMTVNVSGTAVTWVSGPLFSTLAAGQFLTVNAGASELLIISVDSSTALTLASTGGSLSSTAAVAGPGDLISIGSASNNLICENIVYSGGAGGIVFANNIALEDTQKNIIIGNNVSFSAQSCIGGAGTSTGSTKTYDNHIIGNTLTDCGQGGSAVAAVSRTGIGLVDFGSTLLFNTTISGNLIRDDQGSPTMAYGIGVSGLAAGTVFAGNNTVIGTTNAGILGGISSITLSGGFGATSAVDQILTNGDSFKFRVTTSGAGEGASPTATVNTVVSDLTQPPIKNCQVAATSDTAFAAIGGEQNASALVQTLVYQGTPVNAKTYTIYCR